MGHTEVLDDGKLPGNSEISGEMHKQEQHLNWLVEDLPHLFERPCRGDKSQSDGGDSRLGPAIVAAHNGRISVAGTFGATTVFTI
jgi:signal transduction histidine kinase